VPLADPDWGIYYYFVEASFRDIVLAFIFAIIQGPLMGRFLPSSHGITFFVLLYHFFAHLFLNLERLSDYVILIYIVVLHIYIVLSYVLPLY